MQIFEEFWYRNINPAERLFQRQRRFVKTFRLLAENEEKLLDPLNEQERICLIELNLAMN